MSSAPRSKLQQLVLSSYAQFLRAARGLDPSVRERIRSEFRAAAKEIQPSEVLRIEYYLRRANRQLDQLKKGSIVSVGSIKVDHKQMADHKTLPVFAYAEELPQLADIRGYLNSLGATVDPNGPKDVSANLIDVCGSLQHLGKCAANEVDIVLNSVCSLIVTIPAERVKEVVLAFCTRLTPEHFKGTGWGSNGGNVVRVLSNLFFGFENIPELQQEIYCHLLNLCRESRLIGEVDVRGETLEKHFARWKSPIEKKRSILRQVHHALLADQRADQAAKAMIMLLDTYTDADACNAREDATDCVRTAVVDPKSFSFDHLQRLSAVKALQKSDPLMHSALELFNSGTLKEYKEFVTKHPEFISEKLKVDESVLLKKIRLLTLMTIAESNNVIKLEDLSKQLDLPDDEELEEFIIEAFQVNAITGKMNEITRELQVSSYQHRQFGKDQWLTLQKRLQTLIGNIETAHTNMQNISQHVEDAMTAA